MQPAFKSTTRENWQLAHASKTNPPDVAKYTPIYRYLDSDPKSAVVRDEHLHVGAKRMVEKEEQQTHVCLRQIKALNYPTTHEESQAARLAVKNKALLKLEAEKSRIETKGNENPLTGGGHDNNDENDDDKEKKKDDGKLDMLNLYVKELRQPVYQSVAAERKSTSPRPCIDYTRVYLPNGQ